MKHRRSWHLGGIAAVAAAVALAASACGGGAEGRDPEADDHDHGGDHHDGGRSRSRRSPACPIPSGASLTRPALSVKVENTDAARPQAGIDQADVVYEEVVEGNITRFVAIFNSDRARRDRPGAVGARRGPRRSCGPSAASSPTREARRSTSTPSTRRRCTRSTRTPPAARWSATSRASRPATRRTTSTASARPSSPSAATRSRRRRCSSTSRTGSPAVTGRGVLGFHVGFDAGLRPHVDLGRRRPARGSGRSTGSPSMVTGPGRIAPANVVVQFTPYTR